MDERKQAYDALGRAIRRFVAEHGHPDMQRFAAAIAGWSEAWKPLEAQYSDVAGYFPAIAAQAGVAGREMLDVIARYGKVLRWEQSYSKADNLVGDDLLADYGFVEVIGKWGPFVSETVRSGVGLYGANVTYPLHRHGPEEVYGVLSGGAEFRLDGDPPAWRKPGNIVYVRSGRTHGFRVGPEPMVVFYIWQNGDLRETSTFRSKS